MESTHIESIDIKIFKELCGNASVSPLAEVHSLGESFGESISDYYVDK